MSEQRFKKGVNLSCIDTETGKTYWYACNLRGLLNELAEENEQLKEELKLEQDFASRWQKESEMLAKENEQLKQKLENISLHEKNDAIKMIDGKVFIRM